MTCEELHSQPSWNTHILHINSLLTAIPKCWKDKINSEVTEFQGRPCFGLVISKRIMPITKVTSSKVYWDAVNEKIKRPTVLKTWIDLFPFLENVNWSFVYSLVYKISGEPYLQSFQYKIINRSLNCRHNLYKWNKIPCNKCVYCPNIDTLEHHFCYCSVSEKFWCEIGDFLYNVISVKINLSVCEILFGIMNFSYGESNVCM